MKLFVVALVTLVFLALTSTNYYFDVQSRRADNKAREDAISLAARQADYKICLQQARTRDAQVDTARGVALGLIDFVIALNKREGTTPPGGEARLKRIGQEYADFQEERAVVRNPEVICLIP